MTMRTVSISELKAKLSQHLRHVRNGGRLIVTSRGRPVAVVGPVAAADEDERLARLEAEGVIRRGGLVSDAYWEIDLPRDPDGALLKALLEEREEGW